MKKLLTYLFFILFIQSTWAISDKGNDDVVFIENKGQWHKNVLYKLEITNGALFFEQDRVSWRLIEPSAAESVVGHENHNHGFTDHQEDQLQFIFQSVFVGANLDNIQVPTSPREDYRNYIMGDNPKNWASNVKLYKQLTYKNLYNFIDVEYYGYQDYLKYDWIVHPGGNTNDIVTAYTKNVQLSTINGELIIHAPTGEIKELKPYAYQLINGTRNEVVCEFNLKGQEVSFTIGDYDKSLPLVIDPQVVFSSYSGSTADNWGFTATYDNLGRLYGGGVVFDVGYPITTNNVQNVFNKPPNRFITTSDIGISVFNSTGSALIYSTYLGGKDYDQPQSMVVNKNMELVVYGTTGSSDFPIPSSGYRNFHSGGPQVNLNGLDIINGADIFVVKLNSQGNAITGGTFMGGIKSDGPNFGIYNNYGDISRGEVVLDSADNIYVASSSVSDDFPTTNGVSQRVKKAGQDAVVFKLNPSVTTLLWSTYFGGNSADAGYSLTVTKNGVYVCGGTKSSDLTKTSGSVQAVIAGGTEGYIARFNQNSGVHIKSTYLGTSSYDQAFMLDADKFGNIYVFGQTKGPYAVSPNVYSNTGGGQFIHKVSADLSTTLFSTVFGSGGNKVNIVPTAFNVDDCLNILLSGWGGITNSGTGHNGGSTFNMPLTNNAYQANTDGSDFYFMVLEKNAASLSYATYFGGNSQEHVDGGTSRFSQDGIIYQAVCAGCGNKSFPTTPGAYSTTNGSSNCNLGVIKVNFDIFLKAKQTIDWAADVDTNCNTLTIKFTNLSQQADAYEWDFGNGQTSNDVEPTINFDTFGTYTIQLIAFDTICDVSDTSVINIDHDLGVKPVADFNSRFIKCDLKRTASFENTSRKGANTFIWDFGDGLKSSSENPTHVYSSPGTYNVSLIAIDSTCGAADTATSVVYFNYDIPQLEVNISAAECGDGSIEVQLENDSTWYVYEWSFSDGTKENRKYPKHKFTVSGNYSVSLTVRDTVCNTEFYFSFSSYFLISESRLYIPNAFTPNGDLNNEFFEVKGNACLENSYFVILDSFGNEIFTTQNPFVEFWDGTIDGMPAQQDVYVYRFTSDLINRTGYIVLIY